MAFVFIIAMIFVATVSHSKLFSLAGALPIVFMAAIVGIILYIVHAHTKQLAKLYKFATANHLTLLHDVPTLEEAGVNGVEITQWYALFAPGKTPRPVIDLLNKTLNMNTALADKDVVRRIEEQGAVVDTSTPEQLALTVKQELAKWKGVVLKAQLTPD